MSTYSNVITDHGRIVRCARCGGALIREIDPYDPLQPDIYCLNCGRPVELPVAAKQSKKARHNATV